MSKVTIHPYLFFSGNCKEAMEFYKSIFGGELYVMTRGDAPGNTDESSKDKIMHASLHDGEVNLLASDVDTKQLGTGKIELCLGGEDEPRLKEIFDALSDGADVQSPLKKEFWGDTFGALKDKYGVNWMVNITTKKDE